MTIIAAIILFGIIVFIHELGHFLFAKKAGVKIHEFSIGMGPKIYSKQKGETKYSLRLLPLGGYVSMEGEDGESKDPNSFGAKTVLQRASIIFAGPFFNIILTILLLIPVFSYMGTPSNSNVLGQVLENTPAIEAGLKPNDKIIEINGNKINNWEDIVNNIQGENLKTLEIKVERDNTTKDITVTPEKNEEGKYVIGITPVYDKSILKSVPRAFIATWDMIKQMLLFVVQLFTGTVPGGFENSVAGPVGVISIVSDAAKVGIINVVYIGAVISLNLGILNLLPIPALDGGRLLFLLIEAIRGKKMDPNKEGMIHTVGLMLLMGFMLFVTYKDIVKLF
ncbi:RIP metalloprotease RseP [Romboutsia sp. 13368]|uniref:RIP metalloprotease RseP n=1 Tax=Romboutsia sp. 13368 TaxID=2708053 RepID=UPI0025DE8063|nr:RIP metalloprotease RseP [Romboutsia sp. 13368]